MPLSRSASAATDPVSAIGTSADSPGWETALGWAGAVGVHSSTDAWIVQYCNGIRTSCRSNAVNSTLMHWDGTSWSNTTVLLSLDLDSVVADSPTDAWAVGYRERGDGTAAAYVLHWNCATWSQATSPSPGSNSYELRSVSAISSTDVWAVGYTWNAAGAYSAFVLHWNGTSWLQFASPTSMSDNAQLNAVSATAGGAWTVGTTGNFPTFAPLFLRLSGGRWSEVNGAEPGGSITRITGVSTVSSTDAWMVGAYCPTGFCTGGEACTGSGCFNEDALVEHWNGQVWTEVTAPDPSPTLNELYGIAADGPSDIWAVGLDQGEQQDRALTPALERKPLVQRLARLTRCSPRTQAKYRVLKLQPHPGVRGYLALVPGIHRFGGSPS